MKDKKRSYKKPKITIHGQLQKITHGGGSIPNENEGWTPS
jgi:hypothetical protein